MGEEAAQIGDYTLRRVGPAPNGEASQFREQGGGFRATARGTAAGLVGRHVRSLVTPDKSSIYMCVYPGAVSDVI